MSSARKFKVKLFADGANLSEMLALYKNPMISGFTTNPTLMRKAGITDYAGFAKQVVEAIPDRPVSFEVFADDLDGMLAQGKKIATWGKHVNVKIPVTNTKGEYTGPVLEKLAHNGVSLNVTAIMTVEQVKKVARSLAGGAPSIVSVFAGRIADTGVDPVPHMIECRKVLRELAPGAELLWASPRELLNVYHADESGCDIITATPDILAKLALGGKDLDQYSLETVQMFYRDATAAGFKIAV